MFPSNGGKLPPFKFAAFPDQASARSGKVAKRLGDFAVLIFFAGTRGG